MIRTLTFALGLFLALAPFAKSAHADPTNAKEFAQKYLVPLISERRGYYKIQLPEGDKSRFTLVSQYNGIVLGRYEVILNNQTHDLPKLAPHLNLQNARSGSQNYVQLSSTIELPLEPNQDPTPILRSMLRSDMLLHPMQTPPGKGPELSPIQFQIIKQIEDHVVQAEDKNQTARSIVILPPGFGKTIIAGKFLEREFVGQPEDFKIYFVVQNKDILDEATAKLQSLLKLKPHQVVRAFGEGAKQSLTTPGVKLVAVTRSTLLKNLQEVVDERKTFKGRVAFCFDEVHHTGKVNGEFDFIMDQLTEILTSRDILLGLTATPWHTDSDIIERFFHNNVATALLTPEEREAFLRERRLIYMSRLMLFRAMAEGYLSPIHSYRQVRYIENEGDVPMLARNFLNDWTERFKDLTDDERAEQLKKDVLIHVPLIKQMIKEIKSTFKVDGDGKLLTPNRGIIFVPSIAHAEVYAFLLTKYAPKGAGGIYAKAYHSELKDDQRAETMDWFRDQEKTGDSGFRRHDRMETKRETVHKYLFAIRAIGEGVDEPRVNHIMLARPYSEEDLVGMRELIQNLGRGSRLSYPKPDFTVSDFTGDMLRLIFNGLDQSLVDRFFVQGGERDFRPPPEEEVKPKTPRGVVLDETTLNVDRFTTDAIVIPERHFSGAAAGQLGVLSAPVVPVNRSVFGPEVVATEEKRLTWREFLTHPASFHMFENGNLSRHFQRASNTNRFLSYSYSGPRREYQTLQEILDSTAAELRNNFTPGGLKLLTRGLKLYRIVQEQKPKGSDPLSVMMTPELIRVLDRESPWTETQLKLFQERETVPGVPSLMQAMLKNSYEYLQAQAPASDGPYTWREVLGRPAFLPLFLQQVGITEFETRESLLRDSVSLQGMIAQDTWEFSKRFLTPEISPLQPLVIRAGLTDKVHRADQSPFWLNHLLSLPDAMVWLQTSPYKKTDNLRMQMRSTYTIQDRIQDFVARGDKIGLEDYCRRVSVVLGQVITGPVVVDASETIEVPEMGEAFKLARELSRILMATWREVLDRPRGLNLFILGSGHSYDLRAWADRNRIVSLRDFIAKSKGVKLPEEVLAKFGLALAGRVNPEILNVEDESSGITRAELESAEPDKLLLVEALDRFRKTMRSNLVELPPAPPLDPSRTYATWREVLNDHSFAMEFITKINEARARAGVSNDWNHTEKGLLDLLEVSEAIWLRTPNFGRKSLAELNRALKEVGLGKTGWVSSHIIENLDEPSPFPVHEGKIEHNQSLDLALRRLAQAPRNPFAKVTWRQVLEHHNGIKLLLKSLPNQGLLESYLESRNLKIQELLEADSLAVQYRRHLTKEAMGRVQMLVALAGLGVAGHENHRIAEIIDQTSPVYRFELEQFDIRGQEPQSKIDAQRLEKLPDYRPTHLFNELQQALRIPFGIQTATWREVFISPEMAREFIKVGLGNPGDVLTRGLDNHLSLATLGSWGERELAMLPNVGRLMLNQLREVLEDFGLGSIGSIKPGILRHFNEPSPFPLIDGKLQVPSMDEFKKAIQKLDCEDSLRSQPRGFGLMI